MLENRYQVKYSPGFELFEFVSVGPKGNIRKAVIYTKIYEEFNYYNLGFGDRNLVTGFINDIVVTNNNDSQKVLATVASTLSQFFIAHPNAVVIATGSTDARTRLYQIGITNNLPAIERLFVIWGLSDKGWQLFAKGNNYRAFSIRKRYLDL